MTEKGHESTPQPPFDEETQWSGSGPDMDRDPIVLGDALRDNPVAQEVGKQKAAQIRATEAELQALLDDPTSSNEKIADTMKHLEKLRAEAEGSPGEG